MTQQYNIGFDNWTWYPYQYLPYQPGRDREDLMDLTVKTVNLDNREWHSRYVLDNWIAKATKLEEVNHQHEQHLDRHAYDLSTKLLYGQDSEYKDHWYEEATDYVDLSYTVPATLWSAIVTYLRTWHYNWFSWLPASTKMHTVQRELPTKKTLTVNVYLHSLYLSEVNNDDETL